MTPAAVVAEPTAFGARLALVARGDAGLEVVDRAFVPDRDVEAGRTALTERWSEAVAALPLVRPHSEATARALGEFVAVSCDGDRPRGAGQVHLGVGVPAGLIRIEGRVLRDRRGVPLVPHAGFPRAWARGTLAAGPDVPRKGPSPWDDAALAAAAARLELAEPTPGLFDPTLAADAIAGRIARADANAAAFCGALQRSLGVWIGGLVDLLDAATVVVHAPAALHPWLGLRAGEAVPLDQSPLAAHVARHAFASLREGVCLCAGSLDPDAVALGAAADALGLVDV